MAAIDGEKERPAGRYVDRDRPNPTLEGDSSRVATAIDG
jgi:hypothetical protein